MINASALTQQLLDRLHAGGAWRFLWTPQGGQDGTKKRSVWFPVDAPIISPAAWADKNVYFGVNPSTVQREYYEASTNDTIAAINCLFAEFDGADFTQPSEAEREAALTEIMAESPNKAVTVAMREAHTRAKKAKFLTDTAGYKSLAFQHIMAITPAPSVIVDSGGGYQVYWLLEQTFPIGSNTDRAMARHVQAAWVDYVGGDPGAKDLRRVLRLPGTTNRKKHFAPNFPMVSFVKFDLGQSYRLADLAALLPTPATAPAPTQAKESIPAPTKSSATFDGESVIVAYNAVHNIRTMLLDQGYTDAGGKRMSRPGQPDSAGVELDLTNNRARFWSSNDDMHDPHWRRPFDLFCHFDHGNDVKAAVKAAADALGMTYTGEKQPATIIDATTGEIIPLADLMEFCRQEIARRMVGMKDSQINVALAIVQIFENVGTIEAPLSDRYLAGLAAVTHQTANHARKGSVIYRKETLPDGSVKRIPDGRKPNGLDQWLITRTGSGNGILADTYKLSDEMIGAYREKSSTSKIQHAVTSSLWMISRDMLTTIEQHMVDDAFIRNSCKKGVKRSPKALTPAEQHARLSEMMNAPVDDKNADRLVDLMTHGQTENDIKRLDSLSHLMNSAAQDNGKRLKSFTTAGLHIIAALTHKNGMNIDELATGLNKHPAVISAAVKRLARTQIQETTIKPLVRIVEFGTSHRVFLYKTWETRLAAIRPMLHTDGLLKARQIGYANQRIRRIDKVLPLVRNEGLKQLYIEIRERTERMIATIEGKQTAKEAAQLLHQEIAQETAQPVKVSPPPAKVLRFWLGSPTDETFGHQELMPALPVTPTHQQPVSMGYAA